MGANADNSDKGQWNGCRGRGPVLAVAVLVSVSCASTVEATRIVGPAEVDYPDEWYALDDPAAIGHDKSGHGFDALPVAVTVVADPVRGNVARFNSSELIVVPKMQEDFTISLWLKTSQMGPSGDTWASGPRIVDADVQGVHLDFALSLLLDKLAMGTGTPGNATADSLALKSQRTVVDGTWHHVAIMRDGVQGLWQIFVDGMPDASRAGATGPLTINSTFLLGGQGNTSPVTPPLVADLSDVRLYSRVLSPAGVMFLATQ